MSPNITCGLQTATLRQRQREAGWPRADASPLITAWWRCSPGEVRMSCRSRDLRLSSLEPTPQRDGRGSGCELLNIIVSFIYLPHIAHDLRLSQLGKKNHTHTAGGRRGKTTRQLTPTVTRASGRR